jgi:Flp pilus assembly pilin Flp
MTTIYFKSLDEKTVVSLRGTNPRADVAGLEEYIEVTKSEFFRVKKIIHNLPTPMQSGEIILSKTERGQALVECTLALAVVAAVVIAALIAFGPTIGNVFTQIVSGLMP